MAKEFEPDIPFREAGAEYMLAQCRKLAKHLPGARLGEDPEEVHDVRVAIRRLRTAMTIFRACFPARSYHLWHDRLTGLADALSNVRDQDVQVEWVAHARTALPDDRQAGIDAWLAEQATRRASAHAEMVTVLDQWESDHMTNGLWEVIEAAGTGPGSITEQATQVEAALWAAAREEGAVNA